MVLESKSQYPPPLDTLAQLMPNPEACLQKKAKRKAITVFLAGQLIGLKNHNIAAYRNMFYCNSAIAQDGQELHTSYCKNRFCLVCNSIKTANLINGYVPELQKMNDPQFMTLTVKAVKAKQLRPAIERMQKDLRAIVMSLRKYDKLKIVAIRKLECNYNIEKDTFNPHYHFVIDGEYIANRIRTEWLNRNPRSDLRGQDIRPADVETMKELFKYATKIIAKNGTIIPTKALDTIYSAFRNKRVVQPIGIKKVVDEDERESIQYTQLADEQACWNWNQEHFDWVNTSTGEFLSGFAPDRDIELLYKQLRE